MEKLIFILSSFLIVGLVAAQDRVLYRDGKTIWCINDTCIENVAFDGSFVFQRSGDHLSKDRKVMNGWLRDGTQTIIGGNGYAILKKGHITKYYFKNGLENGPLIEWDSTRSIVSQAGYYLDGNRHGTWLNFFPNGHVYSSTVYENGKKIAPSLYYYDTGELRYLRTFRNDTLVGPFKEFYINGVVKLKGEYKANVECITQMNEDDIELEKRLGHLTPTSIRYGKWEKYYEDASVKVEMEYGEPCEYIRKETKYGKNSISETIALDCPTGVWIYYDKSGEIIKREKYFDCKKL